MPVDTKRFRERTRSNGAPPVDKTFKPAAQDRTTTQHRKRRMIAAMKEHMAIVAYASEASGVPSNTHYRWMKEDERYREAIMEAEDRLIGFTERKLLNLVNQEDREACKFVLDRRGARHGWGSKTTVQVEGNPNNPVHIQHHVSLKFLEDEAPMQALLRVVQMLQLHGVEMPRNPVPLLEGD